MIGLTKFSEQRISEVLKKYDAFWAYSKEQFEANKKEGVEYGILPGNLICRKGQGGNLVDEMDKVTKEAGKEWIETYGKEACINYELSNHECYYSYDYEDAYNALSHLGITEEEVREVFYNNLH